MSKPIKILWISIGVSLVMTLLVILLPNSINNYYGNPEIYDTGFSYYMWKFRPIDVSNVARVTAWTFFALHFITVTVLLKKLKNEKSSELISKFNYYLLGTNLFFIIIHFVHTWIWYDALAQDTPVWSSQGSVIVMLVLILIMENGRRGLFFGKKIPFPKESLRVIMKSHGTFISLAIIFTFWYHPMEFTWGHLFGFFYMYLLFIQMSMARTKVHNNVYWKVALEVLVMFHGTFVAISTNNAPWAMFLFGFAAIFFITQIYGINLSKKQILISQLSFLVITIIVYLLPGRSFSDINEVVRIPFIEYLLVFVFVYVIYLPIYLNKYLKVSKWIKRILAGILITLLILMGAMIIFSQNPYQAEPEMYDYRVVDEAVISQVVEDGSSITYIPVGSYTTNIVFIPGGKVVPEAYTYLATELANEGYKVTVIKPLLNLAILSPNQAAKYLEADKVNVVIGHSLGGVVASMVTEKNDEVDMLIMMGSYNIKPITSAKTLTIRAEHDINLDTDAYNEAMTTVTYLTEEYIEDGNHAYFGFYGEQRGDGTATISNKEQQDLVVSLILDYIENNN